MGPAALLDYDRKRLRGLVLEEGTANSHVSIVARALDCFGNAVEGVEYQAAARMGSSAAIGESVARSIGMRS